jgi:hypothetical protein
MTIEKNCGFDLSIGHFQRPNRVRTMHKLHFGTKRIHPWPDEDWSWSTGSGIAAERDRIKKHLLLLLNSYKDNAWYEPFFVLHLCFCVHEYRRMKDIGENQPIPSFCSPDRTIVLDLRLLAKLPKYDKVLKGKDFEIRMPRSRSSGFALAVRAIVDSPFAPLEFPFFG